MCDETIEMVDMATDAIVCPSICTALCSIREMWNVVHTRPPELSKYSTKSQLSRCFMSVKLGVWTWRMTKRPTNALKTMEVSIMVGLGSDSFQCALSVSAAQ